MNVWVSARTPGDAASRIETRASADDFMSVSSNGPAKAGHYRMAGDAEASVSRNDGHGFCTRHSCLVRDGSGVAGAPPRSRRTPSYIVTAPPPNDTIGLPS